MNKRANELIKHLDERSATILRKALREEDESKFDYNACRQQMTYLFVTTKITLREAKLKLYQRMQADDETCERYSVELGMLAREAYPGEEQRKLDSYVHEQFLHGIRNDEIKRRLVHDYGKAADLERVVCLARLYEEEKDRNKKSKEQKKKEKEEKEEKIRQILKQYQSDSEEEGDEELIRRLDRKYYRSSPKLTSGSFRSNDDSSRLSRLSNDKSGSESLSSSRSSQENSKNRS